MTADQRRLAAILVADVVGYSKLVGSDESGTLTKLSELKNELVEPIIARHLGRLLKAVATGFLSSLPAVQAMSCAGGDHERPRWRGPSAPALAGHSSASLNLGNSR